MSSYFETKATPSQVYSSLTDLEVDPGLQLSAAVKKTQQTGAGDAVRAACHEATSTRHPAENTVLMVS